MAAKFLLVSEHSEQEIHHEIFTHANFTAA